MLNGRKSKKVFKVYKVELDPTMQSTYFFISLKSEFLSISFLVSFIFMIPRTSSKTEDIRLFLKNIFPVREAPDFALQPAFFSQGAQIFANFIFGLGFVVLEIFISASFNKLLLRLHFLHSAIIISLQIIQNTFWTFHNLCKFFQRKAANKVS